MSKQPQTIAQLRLEADGGSRGNPGIAGSGAVLYDAATKTPIDKLAYRVGKESNNVAEYLGLLRGLEAAMHYKPQRIDIFLDSKLVVEQMSGRWKIKHPRMQELAAECNKLLENFAEYSFTWIPRAKNKVADALSNVAMNDWKVHPKPGFVEGYAPLASMPVHDAAPDTVSHKRHEQKNGSSRIATSSADAGKQKRRKPTPDQQPDSEGLTQLSLLDAVQATEAGSESARANDGKILAAQTAINEAPRKSMVVSQDTSPQPADWKGATTQATRLVLLRHGQTEMSAQKRYSGRGNPGLTQLGRQQAQAAAEFLAQAAPFAAIISSPLQRCQETASAVAQLIGMEVMPHESLIELDFGQWEAKSFQAAHASDPEFHSRWLHDPALSTPDGESVVQVHQRVIAFREWVMDTYPGKKVLVVSHVTPIKSLVAQAMQMPIDVSLQLHLDLASTSVVDFFEDGPSCVSLFNERSYYAQPSQIV
ncbi:MAG: bifunctional RNase H/acid phosphatase [Corynebacterium sp.]|nr:bifunctional RNase H/acid phosphatase [Corynebacterium sp.]